jgi:peptidoglycan/xylan/chitin deacetylase (PgdA/CDA1 family)
MIGRLSRFIGAAMIILPFAVQQSAASVITVLPTRERVVALTFDACEASSAAHLDHAIANYLVAHRIPFTVFMGGKFARDNEADARWLAAQPFVEIENHSFNHNNHMDRMAPAAVQADVLRAQDEIARVTGRHTTLFRFPAGNYSASSLAAVEALGYRVVHWRWPVGDPDPHVTAAGIERAVGQSTRPGDILIMHINGRGVHTAAALPTVVGELAAQGFRFVTVGDALARSPQI